MMEVNHKTQLPFRMNIPLTQGNGSHPDVMCQWVVLEKVREETGDVFCWWC